MTVSLALRRVSRDLQNLSARLPLRPHFPPLPSPTILSVHTEAEDIFAWTLSVCPSEGSVYDVYGQTYALQVLFSEDYPHEPPTVRFVTPLYSPLVTPAGQVCDRMLSRVWTPDQSAAEAIQFVLQKVFEEFRSHTEDDVHHEARQCLETEPHEFERRVKRQS